MYRVRLASDRKSEADMSGWKRTRAMNALRRSRRRRIPVPSQHWMKEFSSAKKIASHGAPFSNRDLDESQALAQRQVCRTRMRAQALRGAADNDSNRLSRSTIKNLLACAFADAADPEREQDLAVYWHAEVTSESEQVWADAGEGFVEACAISSKRGHCAPVWG